MKLEHQTRDRPLMVYDGDCGFCKFWVERWRGTTGDAVEYRAFQEVDIPDVPREEFENAVQLFRRDGSRTSGADAVFEALSHAGRRWRWLSRLMEVSVFHGVARFVYRKVARHREFFSTLNRLAFGASVGRPRYVIARWIFLRGMGAIYLIAFASLAVQVRGLVGRRGILPAADFMAALRLQEVPFWKAPGIFWLGSGDAALVGACVAGMVAAGLAIAGIWPAAMLGICWALYLSLLPVCQRFLGYQWDVLLIEAGALAVLLAITWRGCAREGWAARVSRWLLLWLLFRLMFESGAVKLMSGDTAWRDFSALRYHYETQPLPIWTSWYAHAAPAGFHAFSAGLMFAIELGAPFLILGPRNARRLGAGAMGGLQGLIFLTGNYGFFNCLSILLCALLLDDDVWPSWLRRKRLRGAEDSSPRWPGVMVAPLAAIQILLGGTQLRALLHPESSQPAALEKLASAVAPFGFVNRYGLFAVMTKTRPEIVIEGSRDGVDWKPYEFKWKPGDPGGRPRFVAPHQPRLDWQMWFAALGSIHQNFWVVTLMQRLGEEEPLVVDLLASNPFPNDPPRYLRAVLYEYRFTHPGDRTEAWWTRRELGLYAPVVETRREEN